MKHFSPSKALSVVQADDLGVSESNRCLKWEKENRRGMHVHCSMTGEKEDSFALRSARRSLRSSCHAGSAMRVSQRLSGTPGCYGPGPNTDLTPVGGPGRPVGNWRELPPRRPRGGKGNRAPLLPLPPMGRVLLKVLSLLPSSSFHFPDPCFPRLSF